MKRAVVEVVRSNLIKHLDVGAVHNMVNKTWSISDGQRTFTLNYRESFAMMSIRDMNAESLSPDSQASLIAHAVCSVKGSFI